MAVPVGRKSILVTLVLMAILFFEARGQGIPRWRPLLLLGDASYSIYLWQLFPMLASFILANHFGLPTAVTALVAFVTMMGGGLLAYFLLERPLLKALHRRPARRGITIPAGATAASARVRGNDRPAQLGMVKATLIGTAGDP